MKIRNGFVSNSSSSSFIVTFPRIPKSIDDCLKIMFPNGEATISDWSGTYPTIEIAKTVFFDIKAQLSTASNSSDKVKELAQELLDDGYYIRQRYKISDEEALSKSPLDIARRILKDMEDSSTFEFTYSDNDGDFNAFLEHGKIFRNLPYEYENNH